MSRMWRCNHSGTGRRGSVVLHLSGTRRRVCLLRLLLLLLLSVLLWRAGRTWLLPYVHERRTGLADRGTHGGTHRHSGGRDCRAEQRASQR